MKARGTSRRGQPAPPGELSVFPNGRAAKTRGVSRFRLTRAGWLFLLIMMVVGVVAAKVQASLLFAVFGGMAGTVLTSSALCRWTIHAVSVERQAPPRVWQNQVVHIGYCLRNPRRRISCLGVSITEVAAKGIRNIAGYCANLPPRGCFVAGARIVASTRGRIDLRTIRVSTEFPFGLVRGRRDLKIGQGVLVWPARGRLKCQILGRGASETSSLRPSFSTGGQDEFFGLREYRPDDSPRWIHWRRSAARTPVVREMSKPLPETLWVVLALTADPLKRELQETLIRLATTLVDYAFTKGYRVGLFLGGREIRCHLPRATRDHRTILLDALALADLQHAQPIESLPDALPRQEWAHAQVVLISDGIEAGHSAASALRRTCRQLVVINESNWASMFEDDPGASGDAPGDGGTAIPVKRHAL